MVERTYSFLVDNLTYTRILDFFIKKILEEIDEEYHEILKHFYQQSLARYKS